MEPILDSIGQGLWFLMFGTPLITIPLVWKFSNQNKVVRVLIGLFAACFLSFILYFVSLEIIFRDGLGPG